ncbi:MAG: ABC transporter ATP-binding protein [Elusimicrobia bacterium]|nr:ABC transporter ATP-binding protein [Elusimicrobiota bacterium]
MMALFETRELHVGYGKIKALHGLSVSVNAGEVVALIGANGAGKSSFLKTVSGLLKPVSGEIYFEGERIDRLSPHEITRRGIAQIPEGRRIFPLLSVEENLMMGAFFRKDAGVAGDLDRIYNDFPVLKERRRQLGGTLSGGEQQMLAFGRALMSRPKLLALDEPSMGLAPVIVDKVFRIVRDLNAGGMTILLVEQNARAALSVAQRGYVMETGTVVLNGPTSDLLANDRVRRSYLGVQEDFLT